MKIPMRWHLTVAAVTTAGLLLTGCGQQATTTDAAAPTTLSTAKATGTLTVWAQGTEGDALAEFIAPFEAENPDLTVKITPVPWASAQNKYQTSVAGGTAPDVGQLGTDWMPSFATSLLPTPTDIDTSGMFPEAVATTELDGTHYGVPWYSETRAIWYRKDLVAAAGFPTFPTTWDEFVELNKALKANGAQYGVNLSTSGLNAYLSNLPLIWSNGGEIQSTDGKSWTFDSDASVAATEKVQSLFADGYANPTPSTVAGATSAAFVDGSTPMFISGPWEIGGLTAAGGADFASKVGVAPIPASSPAASTSFISGSDLVVFKGSKNPDAAWKLIDWLSKPENQVAWYKAVGDLPSQQASWTDSALTSSPVAQAFGTQLKSVNSLPSSSTWPQVSAQADTTWEQIVKGTVPVSEGLSSLQTTAESIGSGN